MSDLTRRSLAKGTAWSIPAITVAASAPALAASSCSGIVKGSPLPASAFTAGYYIVTLQSNGFLTNKVISSAAGISLTPAAAACVGGANLSFAFNTTNGGTMTLTNGSTYTLSGGAGVPGSGTAGRTNGGCSGPAGSTGQACNTYIAISLNDSTRTSTVNPASSALNYNVTVAGYGTTAVTLNVASFSLGGTNWNGSGITFS